MPFMESRIIFYVAKVITEQINVSEQYDKIKRVISIIITDHSLIKNSDKYHHHFGLYDIESMELSADEKARQVYEARIKEQRDIRTREQGAIIAAIKSREL